jgi:hypothetical protein
LVFKIIAILHSTLLATFIKLLQTVSKGIFRNRSQNRCHKFLECRHVCKTCAFQDALQAGKQNDGHCRRQIWGVRWVDFFLFPRLKSIMKNASFADVAAIQERVTVVLRSIPKQAFADSFQKVYERCQQCVVKDGDYFEGQ